MLLSWQNYRNDVLQLVSAALQAVDPARAVQEHMARNGRYLSVTSPSLHQSYDLARGRVFLVSVGKAAVPMATAVANILGDDLTSGIVVTKNLASSMQHSSLTVIEAGHPIPDERSVQAATAVLDLLTATTADDLVIFCISGGASALITQPRIPFNAWQKLTDRLLASGCTINELNTVRRQLDLVKGGGLAQAAAPAQCVSLILSDVIGNDLATIGSGPTVPIPESPDAALSILTRYNLPPELVDLQFPIPNSPPPVVTNLIISDVRHAAQAALTRAARLGFLTQIVTTHLEGEAREAGKFVAAIAKDLPTGHCAILGGETTVTLRGNGRGGRNQELALATAVALEDWPNVVVATLATDGEDGPTDAAGAVVTGSTVATGKTKHLNANEYLHNNDSYHYFKQLDEEKTANATLIQPGSTGTNVNDLVIILTYKNK